MILDTDRYRYRDFVSDISGQDIRGHQDKVLEIIRHVRDYLFEKNRKGTIPSASIIHERFEMFKSELPELALDLGWKLDELTYWEYQYLIRSWLKIYVKVRKRRKISGKKAK